MLDKTRIRISLLHSVRRAFFSNEASNYGPNNSISPFMYNRNPRNLERLRIAHKPSGFAMDNKPSNYWHRLVIKQSNKHICAHVEHYKGNKVVSASSEEWAIKQFLRSTADTNAAKVIGKVLAQRCLECGLLEIHSSYEADKVSPKVLLILKNIEDGGIALKEPERFLPHRHWSREAQENPTQIYEDMQST